MSSQLREPADAALARCERTRHGLDDPVAELAAQALDVDAGRRVRPHVAVHRRRDDDRRRRREAGREHGVVGDPAGHRAQPAGGRRGHDDGVGRVGDDDVPDPLVGEEVEDVGLHGVARQRLERQRADEAGRRRGEHDDDVGALGGQAPQQLDRLVGGDRAAHPEADQPALETAAPRRGPVRRSPAAGLHRRPARDLRVEDRQALEREVGVDDVDALDAAGPRRGGQAAGQDRADVLGLVPAASASSARTFASSPDARAW